MRKGKQGKKKVGRVRNQVAGKQSRRGRTTDDIGN